MYFRRPPIDVYPMLGLIGFATFCIGYFSVRGSIIDDVIDIRVMNRNLGQPKIQYTDVPLGGAKRIFS
jgi:hypothetical protein